MLRGRGAAILLGFAWAGAALAQDGVIAYGVADVFATQVRATGLAPVFRIDSSGLLASRIGVRGSEALGDGIKANFTLEIGVNANDGSAPDANRLANRQAWLGVSGAAGELRLGRQNTPQFTMNGRYDAFLSATQASGWNNLFGAPPRTDSALGLFSPKWGGVRLQALLARGATGGGAPLAQSQANQNTHLAAEYEQGDWYAGLNHQLVHVASLPYSVQRVSAGVAWTANSRWKLYAALGREARSDASLRTCLLSLSAARTLAGGTVLAFGGAALRDQLSGTGHGGAGQLSVQLRRALSRRTTVYGAGARLLQHGLRNSFFLNGSAVVEAGAQIRSPLPGGSISGLQLGITHSF
ncbi:MAG: porin [Pseudomonadota bacterium]